MVIKEKNHSEVYIKTPYSLCAKKVYCSERSKRINDQERMNDVYRG